MSLEESLALWERGEELARLCRHWLEGARARLDAVLAAEEQEELAAGEAEQRTVDREEAARGERGK